jgi:4-diphosphocytidyl-2-C-methyl-D-erythritol kinase
MGSVTLRAFAKINLSLRVSSARPDGFHEVRTILQAIDLFDRVKCESLRGPFQIRCDMSGVPTDRTNLVWKAAQLLWDEAERSGEPCNTVVTLHKSIPMKAGLGGGSSDAAAALLGLRRLWTLRVPDERIHALAAKLGCDVPFFLVGGTALGLGRGEEVYPLENLPPYHVVLAIPPFGIATNDAYGWLDAKRLREPFSTDAPERASGSPFGSYLPDTWLGRTTPLVNDLEGPVVARHPVIGQLKQRFTESGALMAAMSGSGSTVFGVFTSGAAARRAARGWSTGGARVMTARFQGRFASRIRVSGEGSRKP